METITTFKSVLHMKHIMTEMRKQLATVVITCASVLAIATARFERDPQSCGMVTIQLKKKKDPAEKEQE